MKKERSYLELSGLPLEGLTTGVQLSSILEATSYDQIAEGDKRDLIVIKEAFVFVDRKKKRVGVFTRSDRDHGTKIGQCSTLLCGNFDKSECTITQDGQIIYDVKDRLHNYLSEISGLFIESRTRKVPAIYYHDKERQKRYLFLVFELECSSDDLPLCCDLDNRTGDTFVGLRDIRDVERGVAKYNRSPFHVDNALVGLLSKKKRPFSGKFSVAEKIVDAKLASFTLVKFSLIGI
ncbi:MAG: hypothetical protein P1U86_04300 [Verrucomicrobiales bacterium]|nr:hypothetical protein [Verrucomicrobiales bacterium]